ncbi:MAG: DNA replication/repair protein RecF [Corallococcus sp.]|nr:DNA replication/repair protein RecF [Corallococcus sp.]MCM1359045.1 DNA replication/repair protein RecF [Corallococcus sp.]MCM1395034.1 DNA replication/repair protein RecF [Corallococcus sp.]
MKITEIHTANYRNLQKQTVTPGQGLNVFVGDNAQGKTNLVESVYLCCIGKSPRTDRDKDLVTWGQDKAYVKIKYVSKFGKGEIEINLAQNAKKQIIVNGAQIAKVGELMGYLNCIYFSPNEIRIISQSPQERRRFMDIDLCQTDKNYFYSLVRFNKALVQRNNALKQAYDLDDAKESVFAWDKLLAEEAARIVPKRREFCEKLKTLAKTAHEKLTDGKETLELNYVTQLQGETAKETYKYLLQLLQNNLEKDFGLRHTSAGCQRDDIAIKINGADVRNFGSQGQLRTTALSLKLAELAIFKNLIGEYPVLILDDVLSELDADRQRRLLNFDPELQILLTSATDISHKLMEAQYKVFEIRAGVCTEKDNVKML